MPDPVRLQKVFSEGTLDVILVELSTDGELLLFKNDVTLTDELVIGDLEECDFDGYARQNVDPFDPAAYDGGEEDTRAEYPTTHTFQIDTGTQDVWGWAIVDGSNTIRLIKKFEAPAELDSGGENQLQITGEAILENDATLP